jgi:glutaryl-CoA dehydrogenase
MDQRPDDDCASLSAAAIGPRSFCDNGRQERAADGPRALRLAVAVLATRMAPGHRRVAIRAPGATSSPARRAAVEIWRGDQRRRSRSSVTRRARCGHFSDAGGGTRTTSPTDFLGIDHVLSDEERDMRDVVRAFVRNEVVPDVGEWFEEARLPLELARELGKLGVLGMHLEGYGCAGASATSYGLTCMELQAGDSGVRSLVSVQGSLAMFAIHRWGSEEQRQQWLPRMTAGEAIGCFGLTEPDAGSDPRSMRTRARRAGDDWIVHGQKMWITNRSIADVAVVWAATDEGVRGFLVPEGTKGFTTQDIHRKLSLRASVTSELLLDDVRLPAEAMLPEATTLRGPLSCLNEARFGIVWGAAGAARSCFEAALSYSKDRIAFGKPIAATQLQQHKLASWRWRSTERRSWRCISGG